jgi:hypothetical protein
MQFSVNFYSVSLTRGPEHQKKRKDEKREIFAPLGPHGGGYHAGIPHGLFLDYGGAHKSRLG